MVREVIVAYLKVEYQNQSFSKTVMCGRCGKTGESPFWHDCGNIKALTMIGNFDPTILLSS